MVTEGANAAIEAAVAFICKSRTDSFEMNKESGTVPEDAQHASLEHSTFVETPSASLLKSVHACSRKEAMSAGKTERRSSAYYGDENRPGDANIDRKEAMKRTAKPRLQGVAEQSPKVNEARFVRASSMQQSSQRLSGTQAGACRSPRDGKFTSHHKSPRGEAPRGPLSPRQGRVALRAVAQPASQHSSGDWPPADACVIYEPPRTDSYIPHVAAASKSSPRSVDMQPRQISRCPSEDSHAKIRRGSFVSPRPSTSFNADLEMLRQRFMPVNSPRPALGHEFVRNPSHDAAVCVEGNRPSQPIQSISLSIPPPSPKPSNDRSVFSPQTASRSGFVGSSGIHDEGSRGALPRGSSLTVAPKSSRSRPSSVFWKPPPEAAALCRAMKSPSFLLNSTGEVPAAPGRESTTDTEGESGFLAQAVHGSSSPKAVAQAVATVCRAIVVPPSPSCSHRAVQATPVSFSYMPPKHHSFVPPKHHSGMASHRLGGA
jgi:hypothetical protein